MKKRLRNALTTLAVPLVLVACAGGPEPGAEPGADEAVIVVDNQNTSISTATVYLVPETGVRQRLGTVTLDDQARFGVAPRAMNYRLVAEHGVDELVSREFTLNEGNVMEWDLDLNQLNFQGSVGSR